MYVLPGQVRAGGQVLGDSDESGEPFWEDGDSISSPVMTIHPPPFQGGQDVGGINGGIVPNTLNPLTTSSIGRSSFLISRVRRDT